MEAGFVKAESSNLPKVDGVMVAVFFANNSDFCSSEFRNVKTSLSSRASYGDDAIGYVQLKREGDLCTLKCKICPEHKVRGKLYNVTLVIDEKENCVRSVECHDCVASSGGCKHAVSFLMWVHRRSEEPSCTSVECYWRKAKLSSVGSGLKHITAKDIAGPSRRDSPKSRNDSVLNAFLDEARRRALRNFELLKYQATYVPSAIENVSMHRHALAHKGKDCQHFLDAMIIPEDLIRTIESATRDQHKSSLWYELRYARVTASIAYEVRRCNTSDGALMGRIMGGKIPDTPAMKRGRLLEEKVREEVEKKLGEKFRRSGLILSQEYPMLAGSPDGISKESIIEIKCPTTIKTFDNYIKDGFPTIKYYAQMQVQMFLTGKKLCYYCVAHSNFESTKNIEIMGVSYNETFFKELIIILVDFWKSNVFPALAQTVN